MKYDKSTFDHSNMTGEKCYTIKKCFSLKLCKKREIKKSKTNNKRKAEKSEKEKNEAKWKKAKNVSKKFVKVTVTIKRKDLYNLSNLERRF